MNSFVASTKPLTTVIPAVPHHKQLSFNVDKFDVVYNFINLDDRTLRNDFGQYFILIDGNIYNCPTGLTQEEFVIQTYEKWGMKFTKQLDGDFAVFLIDRKTNQIVISTDLFRTRLIFYSVENGHIGCASLYSTLSALGFQNITCSRQNAVTTIDLNALSVSEPVENYKIFKAQGKDHYDDWVKAFQDAVKKRVSTKKTYISLSSGYDSGMLMMEMTNAKAPFDAYTIMQNELKYILDARMAWSKYVTHYYIDDTEESVLAAIDEIDRVIDMNSFVCSELDSDDYRFHFSNDDLNIARLVKMGSDHGCLVHMASTGNDWILRGDNENAAFDYLYDGSFGIDVRYPYWDRRLTQEYFLLNANLVRPHRYKGPADYYMTKCGFPFAKPEEAPYRTLQIIKKWVERFKDRPAQMRTKIDPILLKRLDARNA